MRNEIIEFLKSSPTCDEVELFYLKKVLPHDKRSMNEIIEEETTS